ncbi:TlpA family protein disulfide reductase [Rhizobium laguerreae]|uniref:TlpA disulfide reductase family protein n=1 Tax=Rhizobium TaxID=379 RepID=UPI00143F984A|nr:MULTISPECIES: TlpA disulfide reductase family protein [Rhizobium]MBX5196664.1 TlpA family protein disulfide reductase [Rhizobium sp. NZLR10]MBX5211895.1 TlpA family protein disulfide reductase [Rhizobium sp. NZLR11]MBY3090256.1 TlpA family protein disulfide reductase [Rhizobium laguerreae]MBY3143209.1 TlpA family protein disulfide reductase [Rhizobium laguerreae]MBY3165794.1 TlpA family protein disulfide reductase [Rhizobium laguerreae]
MVDVKVGDSAPSIIDVGWVRGRPLETFQPGNVYILVFLTATRGGCAEIMPDLVQLQEKYRTDGLEVIGIVIKWPTTAAAARVYVNAWLNQTCPNLNFRVGVDFTGQIHSLWMDPIHSVVPYSFVLDRGGKVASVHPIDLDDVVRKALDVSQRKATPHRRC